MLTRRDRRRSRGIGAKVLEHPELAPTPLLTVPVEGIPKVPPRDIRGMIRRKNNLYQWIGPDALAEEP